MFLRSFLTDTELSAEYKHKFGQNNKNKRENLRVLVNVMINIS